MVGDGKLEQINVLITAVGGPTGLGILKCLKGIENLHLIGTDSQRHTAGNMFCDKLYCISRVSNLEEYKKEIAEIVRNEKIDIIFPTLQDEIVIYQEFKEELQTKVALPLSHNFEVLIDKEKLYKYLEENNLNEYIPKYQVFQTNDELKQIIKQRFNDDQYVCVKGVQGHSGLGFGILTNRKNYLEALSKGINKVYNIEDYYEINSNSRRIVMEYLSGVEYSVDVLMHDGEVIVAVPRRRDRVSNGIVIDGIVEKNQEIIDMASKIAQSIAYNGFINLQFINSNEGYKVTDVNSRFCGSQVMSFGADVNFPYLYIKYNLMNDYVTVSPKWNTRMLRYWESCFFYD